MFGGDGLLLGFVADLVGFAGDEVDELGTAVHHQLAGIVGYAHVGQSLFNHLVDGGPGDRQVIIVSGGGGHAGEGKIGSLSGLGQGAVTAAAGRVPTPAFFGCQQAALGPQLHYQAAPQQHPSAAPFNSLTRRLHAGVGLGAPILFAGSIVREQRSTVTFHFRCSIPQALYRSYHGAECKSPAHL